MDLWSIPVQTPAPFTNRVFEFPMSDTIRTDTCSNCIGKGETRCPLCDNGRVNCNNCVGRGRYMNNSGKNLLCSICSASGKVSCRDCHGTGWQRCTCCNGKRESCFYAAVCLESSFHSLASSSIYK